MGHRGEISSVRIDASADNLTYFFNFKLNRNNDLFLNFVVSIKLEEAHHRPFRRHGVVVFEEELAMFFRSMEEGLQALLQQRPFEKNFQTASGRKYCIFLCRRGSDSLLTCREENEHSINFISDAVNVPSHLAAAMITGIKRSREEWQQLQQQRYQAAPPTSSLDMVKVRVIRKPKVVATAPNLPS